MVILPAVVRQTQNKSRCPGMLNPVATAEWTHGALRRLR